MICLRVTSDSANPAIITDLVMLNNAVLTAIARAGFDARGGSWQPGVFFVTFLTGKRDLLIGSINLTINNTTLVVVITAPDAPSGTTLMQALNELLAIKDCDVRVLD